MCKGANWIYIYPIVNTPYDLIDQYLKRLEQPPLTKDELLNEIKSQVNLFIHWTSAFSIQEVNDGSGNIRIFIGRPKNPLDRLSDYNKSEVILLPDEMDAMRHSKALINDFVYKVFTIYSKLSN